MGKSTVAPNQNIFTKYKDMFLINSYRDEKLVVGNNYPLPNAEFNFAELQANTQIVDSSGNDNHGIYFGNVTKEQTGPNGWEAIKLLEGGGHLRLGGDVFSMGTGELTDTDWCISFWYKRPDDGKFLFFSKRGGTPAGAEWQAQNLGGSVNSEMYSRNQFGNRQTLNVSGFSMINDDTWRFAAFIYDRTNNRIVMKRDENIFTANFSATWTNIALTAAYLHIGSDRGGGGFSSNTFLSRMKVWKGVVPTEEELEAVRNEV